MAPWRQLETEAPEISRAGTRDDEFVLRCRAYEDPDSVGSVRAAAEHVIHDDDHVVRLDIDQGDHGWWEHVGKPGTYPIRSRWLPGRAPTIVEAGRRQEPEHGLRSGYSSIM